MPEMVRTEFITCPGTNPHEETAELRRRGPVHKINYPAGAEAYVVLDHETCVSAFNDQRLSKRLDNAPAWFRDQTLSYSPVITQTMLLADAPEHARLRGLVSRAFLPRRMEPLRPRIQDITDSLIDAFPDSGELDLMSAFAFPLPLMVICEFLGVPYQDRPKFQEWAAVLSQSPNQHGAQAERRKLVNDEVSQYFSGILAQRRAALAKGQAPPDDLITSFVHAAKGGEEFSDAELVSTLIFLIIAGHKTTANLIGNGVYALLSHPGQLALLRSDPGLVTSAVEEFLRFEGPVDRGTLRVAAQDVRIGDVTVPKQSFVHLSVTAADRDPAVFRDPDELDITRSPNRHVAFGHGAHFCAGAPLARLEGQVAFATLLRRLPVIEAAQPVDELTWLADSSISRGLEKLPVRIEQRLGR